MDYIYRYEEEKKQREFTYIYNGTMPRNFTSFTSLTIHRDQSLRYVP